MDGTIGAWVPGGNGFSRYLVYSHNSAGVFRLQKAWVATAMVALAITSGCAAKQPVASVDDDVREAIFRYQFQHNHSGIQQQAAVYCLSVSEKTTDPTDTFTKRFEGNTPPVKKVSECSASADKGVSDKATGGHGLIFRIGTITLHGTTEATAEGGYYEGGDSASGNVYQVRRQGSEWVVTEEKGLWIS
jgi:hypothetical protein